MRKEEETNWESFLLTAFLVVMLILFIAGAGRTEVLLPFDLANRISDPNALTKAAAADSAFAHKSAIADSAFAHKSAIADSAFAHKSAIADSAFAHKSAIADSAFLHAATFPDSVVAGIARDTTKLAAAAYDDSLFSRIGKEHPCPLPDYCDTTASAQDSTTVKTLFNIDGGKGKTKMLLVYGNASAAQDTTIWGGTFYPFDDNPDSLYVYAATSDSANTSYSVEVWNSAGAILFSSGNITFTNNNVFERKAFAFGAFATLDEHAIVYRVRVLNAGDAVKIGQAYLKRN